MPGLDATHDPARRSWVNPRTPRAPTSRSRTCPTVSSRSVAARAGSASPSATRSWTYAPRGCRPPPPGRRGPRLRPRRPQPLHGAAARRLDRHPGRDRRASSTPATRRLRDDADLRDRALVPQAEAALHLPIFVRELHRFLRLAAPRRERRHHVPRPRERPAAELAAHPDRLQRPRLDRRRLRRADPPPARPAQGPERRRAPLRPLREARHRARARRHRRPALRDGDARHHRRGCRDDLRLRAAQRLVGPRHPGLGVPAARPFQSKAFASSISPWIVTADALAPFRVAAPEPEKPLLPYLRETEPGLYDIALEVTLAPEGRAPTVISRSNYRHMYYSAAQQLTHHAVGGCAMCTGDLLGSGTISGPTPRQLRLAARDHLERPRSDRRRRRHPHFVEDGDTLDDPRLVRSRRPPHRLRRRRDQGAARPRPAGGLAMTEAWRKYRGAPAEGTLVCPLAAVPEPGTLGLEPRRLPGASRPLRRHAAGLRQRLPSPVPAARPQGRPHHQRRRQRPPLHQPPGRLPPRGRQGVEGLGLGCTLDRIPVSVRCCRQHRDRPGGGRMILCSCAVIRQEELRDAIRQPPYRQPERADHPEPGVSQDRQGADLHGLRSTPGATHLPHRQRGHRPRGHPRRRGGTEETAMKGDPTSSTTSTGRSATS